MKLEISQAVQPTVEDVNYLKNRLLSIPEFIDNEYLKLYCELIIKNQKREYIKFETQSHHIVPRAYFKEKQISIDDSENNIVILTFSDHVLAHYYMVMCIKESRLRYKMLCALIFLHGNIQNIENVNESLITQNIQKIYSDKKAATAKYRTGSKNKPMSEIGRKNISEAQKGRVPWNKGLQMSDEHKQKLKNVWKGRPKSDKWRESRKGHKNKASVETKEKIRQKLIGHEVSKETRDKIGKVNKGKKWMNNGDVEIYVTPEYFEYYKMQGYVFGRNPSSKIKIKKNKKSKKII